MEVWKDIPGFEGYQASSLGKIRSLDRVVPGKNGSFHKVKGCVLKPGLTSYEPGRGYYRVRLFKKFYLVHILVWITFRGPIPEGMQVNHIDENKLKNCIDNLNLLSPSQNNSWGTRIERIKSKTTNGRCSKTVFQFDLEGNFINQFPSIRQAIKETGANHISEACRGLRNNSGGYCWSFSPFLNKTA